MLTLGEDLDKVPATPAQISKFMSAIADTANGGALFSAAKGLGGGVAAHTAAAIAGYLTEPRGADARLRVPGGSLPINHALFAKGL
jgi:hypothetical protein